jgi:hypothetical protein
MCAEALKSIMVCINDWDGVGQGKFSGFKSANILYENLELSFVLIY